MQGKSPAMAGTAGGGQSSTCTTRPIDDAAGRNKEENTTSSLADHHAKQNDYIDKTLSSTANLVKLLPTGTTLAFQALAPSFTNHGKCLSINRYISGGLIAFCCAICALLSFTDSITDRKGRPYYGLALPLEFGGFIPFNYEKPRRDPSNDDDYYEEDFDTEELVRRRLRLRDFIHATLRVFVFAVAFSDAGIQTCLFPMEKAQWKEALVNMPLGVGFIASFVFMIFPSTRKGVGYGADSAVDTTTTTTTTTSDDGDKLADDKDKSKPCSDCSKKNSAQITDGSRVAPASSDDHV